MDEKTTRIIRSRVYVAFAVVAVIMAFILTGAVPRVALVVCAVYCLFMAWYNYRKANEDGKGKK